MSAPGQIALPLPAPQPGAGDQLLADKLHALLVRRGRPLEPVQVAAQVLALRPCPAALARRIVGELISADPRLAWHGNDLVGLAPDGWSALAPADGRYCVVDLETTGGAPGGAKITEIGAVRLDAGAIGDSFEALVNPGRPIPDVVRGITGITDEMVRDAPSIEDVLPRLIEFVGGDVIVAHNAPFDLRFLNYERRRILGSYFTQPWLDTLVLSRRLLRGHVERHDLGSLAEWADTQTRPIHRALADATATAELLAALLPRLAEKGIATLAEAVAYGSARAGRHSHKLALAEDLPPRPGVYFMRDRDGGLLYVGVARNLRRRVRSYFGPGGRHSRRIGRALEELEQVDHEVLGSEFEAQLREGALIRELRPSHNRRGVRPRGHYLKLTVSEEFPRLYCVPRPMDDDALYAGPLRSAAGARRAASALLDLYSLRRCHPICAPGRPRAPGSGAACAGGPCGADDPDAYAREVAALARLLEGRPEALAELGRRAAGFLATCADREAGREAIGGLVRSLTALAALRRAARHSAVALEPGVDPGSVVAFFIAGGRVVDRRELPAHDWEAPAAEGLARVRREQTVPPRPPEAWEADEMTIVNGRLSAGSPSVDLAGPWSEPEALAAMESHVRRARRRAAA